MEAIFKTISNKSIVLNVEPNDSVLSVYDKLYEFGKTTPEQNNIRLILKGNIIEVNEHLRFCDLSNESKISFVLMFIKNKVSKEIKEEVIDKEPVKPIIEKEIVAPKPSNEVPVLDAVQSSILRDHIEGMPITDLEAIHANVPAPSTRNRELDDVEVFRIANLGILSIVRNTPLFYELFNNNFHMLESLLLSDKMRDVFSQFLEKTEDLLINKNNENSDSLPSLSESDEENIKQLMNLGFDREACIQAYLLCNKSMDLAAMMLLDNN
jgi:hypothetical protein